MNPLISVIVPIYNVEAYLPRCLDSIVNQTYRNLEIILVDDGSPDNCGAICDEYANRDSRIRVIHKVNGGSSAARNAGLDVARGEYIGFVDSDDIIRPEMYELLLNALRESEKKIACCYAGWDPRDQSPVEHPEIREVGMEDTINGIFSGQVGTSVWRRLYHRSIWGKLRFPVGETNEDYPILIPTTVAADGMVHVRVKLYFYRPSPSSITSTYWKKDASILLVNLEKMHGQVRESCPGCMSAFRRFAVRGVFALGVALEKNVKELNAENYQVLRRCLGIMRKNWLFAMTGRFISMKDKVLYTMVVTRTLRPIYKLLGKQ